MLISKEKPPIYNRLHEIFGIDWEKGICIVWGDTCHSINDVRSDLYIHEEVHVHQQKALGPKIWWETYITDKSFRLSQELEAYQAQVDFIMKSPELSRAVRRNARDYLAKELAGDIYGNMVSVKKAKELLK